MFYRRKIILSLLEVFDGKLEKISLQKLLFLFTRTQIKPEYDFIPYKYGCYSYSANADLTTMVSKGILFETEDSFRLNGKTNYLPTLKQTDRQQLLRVKKEYGDMSSEALMKYTYVNFPYWAINSLRAESILTETELSQIEGYKPKIEDTILYTIGYEGISLEEYFNRLIVNDVKVLVDVRNNPISMKYGFSKSHLKKTCDNLNISYVHFPEVGIQSEQRQKLNNQADYDVLFAMYRKNNLTKTFEAQDKILNLLKDYKRIALTCFEANICQCHRKHLAEAIEAFPGFTYRVKHI